MRGLMHAAGNCIIQYTFQLGSVLLILWRGVLQLEPSSFPLFLLQPPIRPRGWYDERAWENCIDKGNETGVPLRVILRTPKPQHCNHYYRGCVDQQQTQSIVPARLATRDGVTFSGLKGPNEDTRHVTFF